MRHPVSPGQQHIGDGPCQTAISVIKRMDGNEPQVRDASLDHSGVAAEGINQLAEMMRGYGDVFVVVPDSGRSGASMSISSHTPVKNKLIKQEPGTDSIGSLTVWACTGTPNDCTKMAFEVQNFLILFSFFWQLCKKFYFDLYNSFCKVILLHRKGIYNHHQMLLLDYPGILLRQV